MTLPGNKRVRPIELGLDRWRDRTITRYRLVPIRLLQVVVFGSNLTLLAESPTSRGLAASLLGLAFGLFLGGLVWIRLLSTPTREGATDEDV